MEEYIYRVLQSSWGVYVKLTAEAVQMDFENKRQAVQAGEKLWLTFAEKPLDNGEKFYEGDIPYLKKGLQLVQNQIRSKSRYSDTCIVIHSISMTPTDFQEEGLIAAMIGWSAKVFAFAAPEIDVHFNKAEHKYEFHFW